MLFGIQIAFYLVAAIILAGIAFLGWALLQLVHETRRQHVQTAEPDYEARWRYRIQSSQ